MTDTPPRLIVYEKPSCSTCRRVVALLTERGIDFDRVNYMVNPLSVPQLRSLLDKSGAAPARRTSAQGTGCAGAATPG